MPQSQESLTWFSPVWYTNSMQNEQDDPKTLTVVTVSIKAPGVVQHKRSVVDGCHMLIIGGYDHCIYFATQEAWEDFVLTVAGQFKQATTTADQPASRFITALREFTGTDEGCPVCTGALEEDTGVCTDCGEDFERAARRFDND